MEKTGKKNKFEFFLDDNKIAKLDKIVKELYKINAIDSETIEEFLKLTIYIVLYEYDKNKQSLNEFYRQNREIYKEKEWNFFNWVIDVIGKMKEGDMSLLIQSLRF